MTGPGWLKSEKFDVVATCPPETSSDTIRRMSQGFLGERFALTVHREDKNISAYALIAAKRGPKLRASNVVDPSFTFGDGRIAARGLSMAAFADRLSGPVFKLERPVIDMTGLKGIYDFELEWSSGSANDNARPSLFTALQEQAGLRMEVRPTTVSVLVVDC